jgi:hypothetical protein
MINVLKLPTRKLWYCCFEVELRPASCLCCTYRSVCIIAQPQSTHRVLDSWLGVATEGSLYSSVASPSHDFRVVLMNRVWGCVLDNATSGPVYRLSASKEGPCSVELVLTYLNTPLGTKPEISQQKSISGLCKNIDFLLETFQNHVPEPCTFSFISVSMAMTVMARLQLERYLSTVSKQKTAVFRRPCSPVFKWHWDGTNQRLRFTCKPDWLRSVTHSTVLFSWSSVCGHLHTPFSQRYISIFLPPSTAQYPKLSQTWALPTKILYVFTVLLRVSASFTQPTVCFINRPPWNKNYLSSAQWDVTYDAKRRGYATRCLATWLNFGTSFSHTNYCNCATKQGDTHTHMCSLVQSSYSTEAAERCWADTILTSIKTSVVTPRIFQLKLHCDVALTPCLLLAQPVVPSLVTLAPFSVAQRTS